jgi:transcriptional regulator with XRE-family HTH domain
VDLRDPRVRRGYERGRRLLVDVVGELRDARLAAGLTQAAVARALGVSQKQISRIELGSAGADVVQLAAFAAVVGLDFVVKLYPGGAPVRDRASARMLARLQGLLPTQYVWRTEVVIPIPGDQRAIDAMIIEPRIDTGFEFESRVPRAEGLARRLMLKQRDAGLTSMVLVLADTRANREAVAAADPTIRGAFPLEGRAVLAALRAGRAPEANGILFV